MRTPDWPTLSAYVDGELDTAAAAAVAAAAGRDKAVADKIALLYQVKGVTHAAAAAAPADLADLLPERRRRWPAALAAAAAALVLVAGAFWLSRPASLLAPPTDFLTTARSLHADWLRLDSAEPAATPPALVLATLSDFGRTPVVPDLESTELHIQRVSVTDGPWGRILQVGYRGNHGCHLSLFVFANDELPDAVMRLETDLDLAAGWRVDDLGYLLFAQGMDRGRFALIAEKVEQATHNGQPFDDRTRRQLAENKRQSASCKA